MSDVQIALDNVRQSLVDRFTEERLGQQASGLWDISVMGSARWLDARSFADANAATPNGLIAKINTAGSTNYPDAGGVALTARRSDPTTPSSAGTFDLYSSNTAGDLNLRFRKVVSNVGGNNEVWSNWAKLLHSGADITNEAGFVIKNTAPVNAGESWFVTPAYGDLGAGNGRTILGYNAGGGMMVNYIRGASTYFDGNIILSKAADTGSTIATWFLGKAAWQGTGSAAANTTSSTGIVVAGPAASSQLFTLGSVNGQLSVQLDGSLFVGETISFNPYTITGSSQGCLAVAGNASVGGLLAVYNQVTARGFKALQGPTVGDLDTIGYAFGTDGDTGMFAPTTGQAAGKLRFTGNGVALLDLDSDTGLGFNRAQFGATVPTRVVIGPSTGVNGNLTFGLGDNLGEIGRISFDVDSNERAYIQANRHTAAGQLTDLTLGVDGLSIGMKSSTGYVEVTGKLQVTHTVEKFNIIQNPTGSVAHNFGLTSLWYLDGPLANWTCAITGVPDEGGKAFNLTEIVSQGGTGYAPTALSINGATYPIRWAGGLAPIPSNGGVDVFTFNFIKTGGAWGWLVMGTFTPYAA